MSDNIKEALIATITEIQTNSGRALTEIGDDTRPLRDMQGFDSYNAVEASMLLSESLGCEIVPDIALFARHGQALTVSEIVENLSEIVEQQTEKKKRKNNRRR